MTKCSYCGREIDPESRTTVHVPVLREADFTTGVGWLPSFICDDYHQECWEQKQAGGPFKERRTI